jgi:hypothetical protein
LTQNFVALVRTDGGASKSISMDGVGEYVLSDGLVQMIRFRMII